jgi:hypothetical protein
MGNRQKERLATMTDDQVALELKRYHKQLGDVTNGRAYLAYSTANSMRYAWEELERRGKTIVFSYTELSIGEDSNASS